MSDYYDDTSIEDHNQSEIRTTMLNNLIQKGNKAGYAYRQMTDELRHIRPNLKRFYKLNRRFLNISAIRYFIYVIAILAPFFAIFFDITVGGYELSSFVGSFFLSCLIIVAIVALETASVIYMESLKIKITGDPPINTEDDRLRLFSGSGYATARIIALALIIGISSFNAMSAMYQAQDRRSNESVLVDDLDTSEFTAEELAMLDMGEEEETLASWIIDQFWWLMPLSLTAISLLLHFMIYKFSEALYQGGAYFFSYRWKDRRNRKYFTHLVSTRQSAIQEVGSIYERYQSELRSIVHADSNVQIPDVEFSTHVLEAYDIYLHGESEEGIILTTFPADDSEESTRKRRPPSDGSESANGLVTNDPVTVAPGGNGKSQEQIRKQTD